LLPFLASVVVASCGQSNASTENSSATQPIYSDAQTDPGSKATPKNEYSRELFDMGAQLRRATFRNLMYSSGEQCDLVTEAVLKGGDKKTDFWRVTCTDSGDWLISVAPDSSTKILSCTTMAKLGDNCRAAWRKHR
jgi:hypothetical protein